MFFGTFSGQLQQERSTTTAKLELIIDGLHYYVLVSLVTFRSKEHTLAQPLAHLL